MASVTSGQSLRHSLLWPRLGLAHAGCDALEVGVGQVVQRDGLAQAEQRAGLAEQVLLQGLTVLVQRVRGAVQAVQIHLPEIEIDQLAQRRCVLQPGVRGELAARMGHARDDVAHCGGDLRAVQAQLRELVFKTALAHRRQRGVFDAHAARVYQLKRVKIDLLVAQGLAGFTGRADMGLGGGLGGGSRRERCGHYGHCGHCAQAWHGGLARDDLGCKALRKSLYFFRQARIQH